MKRIAELEDELSRHTAASELKLRSLRQEHERVKSGLQRQLEMKTGMADPGAVAMVGSGGVPRREMVAAAGGGRDPQQEQQQEQQQPEVCQLYIGDIFLLLPMIFKKEAVRLS